MKKNILNDSEFKTKIVEIYREEQIKIIKYNPSLQRGVLFYK